MPVTATFRHLNGTPPAEASVRFELVKKILNSSGDIVVVPVEVEDVVLSSGALHTHLWATEVGSSYYTAEYLSEYVGFRTWLDTYYIVTEDIDGQEQKPYRLDVPSDGIDLAKAAR